MLVFLESTSIGIGLFKNERRKVRTPLKKKTTIPTDESMLKGALGKEKELPMARTRTI